MRTPPPPARLLLVDDREENLLALGSLLESPAHEIHTARSGPEALRKMLRTEYAVVLLDVQMPDMDGFEVARLMRARRTTRSTPIIFVTAYSRTERNIFAGYDAGAVDYLFKPLDAPIVRSKVAVFVQLHQQRAQLARLNEELEGRVEERTRQLKDERTRYQQLVEQMPAVLYVVDPPPQDQLHFISPRITELVGLSPGDLIADPARWRQALHPDDRDTVAKARAEACAQDRPFRLEYRLRRGDGRTVWVRDEAALVADPGTGVHHMRGLLLDITEQRELRQQMERSQRLESIGQLTGSLAHDFNNLLGVILGFASMAAEDSGSDTSTSRALDEIQRAAERGASITQRMLSFARKQQLQVRAVELADQVGQTAAVLRRVLPESIQVGLQAGDAGAWVRVDPNHLDQVLLNLAINARDAMPAGGRLSLSTARECLTEPRALRGGELAAGDYAVVSTSDTGSGMNEAALARIFEPFFTTKEEGKGTGLGLSSSLGIVRQLGGGVDVHSEEGTGTRFDVFLPLSDPATAPTSLGRLTAIGRSGRGERILVVEDEDGVRQMLAESLTRQGFEVAAEPGGAGALMALTRGPTFDAILTDMTMPGMSGLELIDEARAQGYDLPVIVFSGRSSPDSLAEFPRVRFLQKPMRPARIAQSLRQFLDDPDGA